MARGAFMGAGLLLAPTLSEARQEQLTLTVDPEIPIAAEAIGIVLEDSLPGVRVRVSDTEGDLIIIPWPDGRIAFCVRTSSDRPELRLLRLPISPMEAARRAGEVAAHLIREYLRPAPWVALAPSDASDLDPHLYAVDEIYPRPPSQRTRRTIRRFFRSLERSHR